MISAPAGIALDGGMRAAVCDDVFGGIVGGLMVAAAAVVACKGGGVAAWKLQVAALKARIVAGDVASPGTRAIGVSGVLGGNGECDSFAKDVALLNVGSV
jgi:hypothetical protein